jgi:hypothetical protein
MNILRPARRGEPFAARVSQTFHTAPGNARSIIEWMREKPFVMIAAAMTMVAAAWVMDGTRAVAQASQLSLLVGAWTLNHDLSDKPQDRSSDDGGGDNGGARRGGGGGGGRGGGFGGGGRRGGGFGGQGGGGRTTVDPEQRARERAAIQDILNSPEHLTIVQTENMVILTGPDGRTTRLSADGKKVKDDATKIERKTKWDGTNLVSEITGVAGGKITESYSVDPEHHQLRVTLQSDNERRPLMMHRVYDADAR